MATSGSFETSKYNNLRNVVFSWERTNYSVEGNYSDISYTLKGGGSNNGKYYMLHGIYLGITYRDESGVSYHEIYSKDDAKKELKYGTSIKTGTFRVYHENDGQASFDVAISAAIYTYSINCTGNKDFYINSIPRATACPNLSGNIGSSVVAYVSGASSSFTHSLLYSFGNLTGSIPVNQAWTIPNSFYGQIPNSKSGEGTLTLITYSNGSEIGRKTGKLYVYCEEYACKPSASGSVKDINNDTILLTGDSNKLIKGKSNAYITYQVSAKNSASIKNVTINGNKVNNYSSNVTFLYSQSALFNIRVEDSRGYVTETTIGSSSNLINYISPTNNLSIKRNNATGNKVICSLNGNFFNQNFGIVSNILELKWRVKENNESFSEYQSIVSDEITFQNNTYSLNKELQNPLNSNGTWDYQKQYSFEVIISDKLGNTISSFSLKKGKPNHNWYEKQNKNYFNINGALTLENQDIIDIIYPVGIEITFYDNLDHRNFCGRTWVLVSGGKVDVGRNYSDSRFDSVGKSGGSYQLQRHSHGFSATTSWAGLSGRTGVVYSGASSDSERNGIVTAEVTSYRQYATDGERNNKWTRWYIDASHNHSISGSTANAGSGEDNMQPYEVKSKWRRIS